MAKSEKIRSKFTAMITYIVAVVVMLAVLLLPLSSKTLLGGITLKNMPALQLVGAGNAILRPFGYKFKFDFGYALSSSFSYGLSMFGKTIDIGAILLLAFTVITIISLIMLIPVCAVNRKNDAARKIAVVMELIAVSLLFAMVLLEGAKNMTAPDWNLTVLCAFAALIIVLAIQAIVYYGKSGVIKLITVVLSALAVVAVVWNIGTIIPPLAKPLSNLVGKMQGPRPFVTTAGLYTLDGYTYVGADLIYMLFSGASSLILKGNIEYTIVNFVALAVIVVVCANAFLNILGLGKRTNRFTVWFNLIRYIVEFVLVALLLGMVFWVMGSFGLLLYLVTALTLAQLIISICRLTIYSQKYPSARALERKAAYEAEEAESAVAAAPALPAPVCATPVTEEKTIIYKVNTIYNGPTDAFISKLSSEEKVEFARVFLERSTGKLSGVPDYIVGGNNSKFFSSIFIYLARVRDHVSDALMNKLYQEVNLLA